MPDDRYAWSLETARALRRGDLSGIDTLAVAEALEQMGRSEAHEVRSRITQVLEHLLKLRLISGQVHQYNQVAWRESIGRQQRELEACSRRAPA